MNIHRQTVTTITFTLNHEYPFEYFSSLPHQRLVRDASFQSDSSHCSSVESLLELRKADPAAILLDLGFGGSSASPQENGTISRIPRRFLQPSSLRGIAIDEFLKQQQETTESFDSVSLGYRGLTGKINLSVAIIITITLFNKFQLLFTKAINVGMVLKFVILRIYM